MVEYTGREVLLKDENGEVIIPYVEKPDLSEYAKSSDVTSALQQIANKADVDLGNVSSVSSSFKGISVLWNIPDYSAGISVTGKSGFTAPSNGVVILFLDTKENDTWTYVYCNGSKVAMAHGKSGRSNGDGTAFIPVKTGDKITADSNFNSANGFFYPYL